MSILFGWTRSADYICAAKNGIESMEELYKQVFEHSPAISIITDENGKMRQVSNSTVAAFQYGLEELIGQNIGRIIPKLNPEKILLSRNAKHIGEGIAIRKDGTDFPVDLHKAQFEALQQRVISWTINDISDQKQLLTDLRERVKEQLTVLLVTETLFSTESLEHVFTESLPHIIEGLQYPEHTVIRIRLDNGTEFTTSGFRESEWFVAAPIVSNGQLYGTLEIYYTQRFPHINGSPFLKEEHELVDTLAKMFSLFVDQWHTVKKLQDSEALIRKITEQVPGNSYQFELDENGTIHFLFAGKGIAGSNVGFCRDQMRTEPEKILSMIHPEDWDRFVDALKKSHHDQTAVDIHYRIVVEGEVSWRWLRATAEKNDEGKIIWYGYTQDITQIITYIDVLEQIIFDISHVMRKPVTTMLGLTNYLVEHEHSDEKTFREFIQHLDGVAHEIDTYIRNLNTSYVERRHTINATTGKSLAEFIQKQKASKMVNP